MSESMELIILDVQSPQLKTYPIISMTAQMRFNLNVWPTIKITNSISSVLERKPRRQTQMHFLLLKIWLRFMDWPTNIYSWPLIAKEDSIRGWNISLWRSWTTSIRLWLSCILTRYILKNGACWISSKPWWPNLWVSTTTWTTTGVCMVKIES